MLKLYTKDSDDDGVAEGTKAARDLIEYVSSRQWSLSAAVTAREA